MRRTDLIRSFARWLGGMCLVASCLMTSGCALADLGRSIADETTKMFTPKSRDYFDETEVGEDQWSQAGKEGRGDRAKDHESDALTGLISSPKARGIERNLGVD